MSYHGHLFEDPTVKETLEKDALIFYKPIPPSEMPQESVTIVKQVVISVFNKLIGDNWDAENEISIVHGIQAILAISDELSIDKDLVAANEFLIYYREFKKVGWHCTALQNGMFFIFSKNPIKAEKVMDLCRPLSL